MDRKCVFHLAVLVLTLWYLLKNVANVLRWLLKVEKADPTVELELESAIQAKDDGYGPRENPSMTLTNQESYFTCCFAQLPPTKKRRRSTTATPPTPTRTMTPTPTRCPLPYFE
jgi:hypothetical protein